MASFSLLALGYDWTLGNFTFGPSVSAQYTYLRIDSLTDPAPTASTFAYPHLIPIAFAPTSADVSPTPGQSPTRID